MEPNEVQVIPSVTRLAILTTLIATPAPFFQPTIILYQNAIALGPATNVSELTIATFTGYANVVAATWEAPYIDIDGTALVFGAAQTIVATGSAITNTIYGYAFVKADLSVLYAAYAFATPVGITGAGQAVSFLPGLRYSGV